MMKRYILVFLLYTVLIFASACSVQSEDSDAKTKRWFQRGVGVALPAEARVIPGKNYGAWLSDIYLKVEVPPSYEKVFSNHLKLITQAPSFALPDSMEAWPDWDMDGKDFVDYSLTIGDVDRGAFISHLAFEPETGQLFCHFVEYMP